MRLIDADSLAYEVMSGITITENTIQYANAVLNRIQNAPAVDAKPMVRADWKLRHIGAGHYWECSNCGFQNNFNGNYKYCPHCGAKMDEVTTDG